MLRWSPIAARGEVAPIAEPPIPQTIIPPGLGRLEPGGLDPPERVAKVIGEREDVVELVAGVDRADLGEPDHAQDLRLDDPRRAGSGPPRRSRRRPRSARPRRPRCPNRRRLRADRDAGGEDRAADLGARPDPRSPRAAPTPRPPPRADPSDARPRARRARPTRASGATSAPVGDERPPRPVELGRSRPCPRGCPSSPAGSAPGCRCPSSSRRAASRRGPADQPREDLALDRDGARPAGSGRGRSARARRRQR